MGRINAIAKQSYLNLFGRQRFESLPFDPDFLPHAGMTFTALVSSYQSDIYLDMDVCNTIQSTFDYSGAKRLSFDIVDPPSLSTTGNVGTACSRFAPLSCVESHMLIMRRSIR